MIGRAGARQVLLRHLEDHADAVHVHREAVKARASQARLALGGRLG